MDIISIAKYWKVTVMVIIILIAAFYVIAEVFGLFHQKSSNSLLKFIRHKESAIVLALVASIAIMTISINSMIEKIDARTIEIEKMTNKIDDKVKIV